MIKSNKKSLMLTAILVAVIFISQSFTKVKPDGDDHKPTNLKVLPKNMTGDELHKLMRTYAKGLGVKCNFCHEQDKDDPKKMNFAADTKEAKLTARKMITMVNDINSKFIAKIDSHFEKITCVTCHNGRETPIISVDSLAKK
jgi:photosynthetic reaction center cytochrome c subunit